MVLKLHRRVHMVFRASSYDFFVWHKPIAEINPVNYVGAIVAIAFIWAGTKIWKHNKPETRNLRQKSLSQKTLQKSPQQAVSPNSMCSHYLRYLHQRQASHETCRVPHTRKSTPMLFFHKINSSQNGNVCCLA